jgi:hypothetical protein
LRSCPFCGAPAKPVDKFCGQCGSPLGLELQGEEAVLSGLLSSGGPGLKQETLVISAVVIILLIAIGAGYLFMKGLNSAGPTTINQSGTARSIVIVETEVPLITIPTTILPVIKTTPPTEAPTTMKTPKYGICPADRKFCNNNCTDVRTDNKNCGSCGNACPVGQSCTNGNCMLSCSSDKTACPDGCFNLNTDADHCGTCGNNCPAGLVCTNGQCAPPPTYYITAI